jgi:serine/threonine-protein kinase PknG
MTCAQPACGGTVVDGYCDVCGMAPSPAPQIAALNGGTVSAQTAAPATGTATQRRSATARSSALSRNMLGAGLVEAPPVAVADPQTAVLTTPTVAESRRFCGRCDAQVGRSRDGAPGRTEGFCPSCGAPFSFRPTLEPGVVVAGQYEVVGCLAHGGMGWVYLARDRNVSDRWVVLKGLLNTGDDGAMAAALAERRFLAEVEHPNIVKIFNFVEHDSSGYIVMEYVGGTSLKQLMLTRRTANDGVPDPLPAAQAVACMLEILPAFQYLHEAGLLFCDFKIDNVIQTRHSLKLIDLGGVYRMDDRSSPVYGTVGYQAPEIATTGPTVPSDLFTIARTLAVLCIDFRGYQTTQAVTLPEPSTVPLFQRYDSLYRFLVRGTAANPDDRFQSAEEMAGQLVGVLHEILAESTGTPSPAISTLFTGELRTRADEPDPRTLPVLQVDMTDPASGYLAALSTNDPGELVHLLREAPMRTVEVDLRLARALIDAGDADGAEAQAAEILATDPWEWRAAWYRGVAALAKGRTQAALGHFTGAYHAVPGELAPRLALGIAAELGGDTAQAADWYDIVSRTDPAYTSAAFGLARCRAAVGDRSGALAACDRVPEASSAYVDAQLSRIRYAVDDAMQAPTAADISDAATRLERLKLDAEQRTRIAAELLAAALAQLEQGSALPDPDAQLLGRPLTETGLRTGLEQAYRELARRADTSAERIRLVDQANAVRPRTWT